MQNKMCVSDAIKIITSILKKGNDQVVTFLEPKKDLNVKITIEFEKPEIKVLEDGTKWKKIA